MEESGGGYALLRGAPGLAIAICYWIQYLYEAEGVAGIANFSVLYDFYEFHGTHGIGSLLFILILLIPDSSGNPDGLAEKRSACRN